MHEGVPFGTGQYKGWLAGFRRMGNAFGNEYACAAEDGRAPRGFAAAERLGTLHSEGARRWTESGR